MRVLERAAPLINSKYGKLHPFQAELIDALLDPNIGFIRVEAPVGIGKTTVIRKALDYCKSPVVATFPTTILVKSQSASFFQNEKVFVWPYAGNRSDEVHELFITEFTSESLLHLAKKNRNEIRGKRGEILNRLFNLAPLVAKKTLILTTPDVLWLIYSSKYNRSKRLQEALSNSIIFFDEFHCYAQLENFYRLLNRLGEGRVSKVALMSATPFIREDILLDFRGKSVDIKFEEGDEAEEKRIFNYDLDVQISEADFKQIHETARFLTTVLPAMPRPSAVIFDSIFRLMQIENILKRDLPNLSFYRYDGFRKDKILLDGKSVVLGTSAIEVGINMAFSSLIFEGSSWPAAIQRLGRVGRQCPGRAILISDRNFKPFKPAVDELSRREFEMILRDYLPDPRQDWVSGELFRGDAPSFLLVDPKGDCYVYGPSVFSMFEISESEEINSEINDIEGILRDFKVREDDIEDIKIRASLFPVAGIVKTYKFRDRYVPLTSVESNDEKWVIRLANGESFYFTKERFDD